MLNRSLLSGSSSSRPLTLALRRGAQPCSEPKCESVGGMQCAYVDRRQRRCESAWCHVHQQVAYNAVYCRRHAGIINALGPDHGLVPLPDLDNRAPSLANWVGRELDGPIRDLLETHYPGSALNATAVVSGGSWRERVWSRSWKLISEVGVDVWVNISVAEADDSVVKLVLDGRTVAEVTPPWIEARRHGMVVDPQVEAESRRRFNELLLEDLDAAIVATKAAPKRYQVQGWRTATGAD